MQSIILIVDDEKHTREGLRASLEENFDVYVAANIQEAMNVLDHETVDLVLTDLRLGGEDGMQLVEKALAKPHAPIVIMMTAYGSVDAAVEAMRRGAYDFVTKPLNIDRLEILIQRALRSRKTEEEVVELKKQVEKRYGLERLIGESPVMHEVYETIKQVAPTRATVLIQGESGTGKELVAQAIHALSGRPKQKFVAVHCAALAPQLLESELFGHEKGSFTGATERRIGRFEQANGGSIFLDEIGEIDSTTQVKLLRVLGEDRSFERVGGNAPIKVDVRLIAATNKNLAEMVEAGKFRDDLFFRLSVVPIDLPPLRARKEDIPLLVQTFNKQFADENGRPVREITSDAMQAILRYDWPGNVRELRTVIEYSVVMATGPKITLRDLPASVRDGPPSPSFTRSGALLLPTPKFPLNKAQHFNLHATEDRLILQALQETGGNVTQAAKKLGISRRTLHRKLKELRQENPPEEDNGSRSPGSSL
ncbi:MAG TPA: sigma-54 dependent transcriptional regulator [Chthoniobacteraceae bacterium]|jgi:DNA-binding NtrC family response regulator